MRGDRAIITARRAAAALAAVLAIAAAPLAGSAAAKSVGVMPAPAGVTLPGSPYRYVAIHPRVGVHGVPTIVERIGRGDGRVERWWRLRGHYFVPAVAYDLSGGGLSANGRFLVLQRFTAAYPPRRSRFAVLDTALRLRHPLRPGQRRPPHAVRRLDLPGFYALHALSPRGSTAYLVDYTASHGAVDRFQLRALDLASGRLLPQPLRDRDGRPLRLQGLPVTRAAERSGRWAYTLYDGGAGVPFVLALDTVRGAVATVRLPALADWRNPMLLGLRLRPGSGQLLVTDRPAGRRAAGTLLRIDTRTLAVGRPAAPAGTSSAGVPWVAIGAAAAVLAALAAAFAASPRNGLRRPLGER